MISNEDLNKIIKDCEALGHQITVRDISFLLLCRCYSDIDVAGKAIFGSSISDYKKYNEESKIRFLRTYLETNYPTKNKKSSKKVLAEDEITFEENKSEIIKLIRDTQKALEDGKIEPKDAYKIQADLRVKLNDKFSVKEDIKEQVVIVNTKYDHICPNCHTEVSRRPISKEEAMKMYGLVEKC